MPQTPLKSTQLGQTALEITRMGFGAWAIRGGNWKFGFPRPDQVDGVIAAAGLQLTDADVAEIQAPVS